MNAYMFLAEGFEETEAIAPLDLLRRAGVNIKTVKINTHAPIDTQFSLAVCGAHGITLTADLSEQDVLKNDIDLLILPGGMPGTLNLHNSDFVLECVKNANENNALICAICAAPRILGTLGLLNGKSATCYPENEKFLHGATVLSDRPCVRDGKIITARSAAAAVEFGLEIITALLGKAASDKVADAIILH